MACQAKPRHTCPKEGTTIHPPVWKTGAFCSVTEDGATSTIHERDVAAVSARALVDAAHAGHTYVLIGPQSLTQRDRVRQAMLAQSLPEDVPDRLLGYWSGLDQQPGPSSTDVSQVLGRPALTFAEWAAEPAAAFRSWQASFSKDIPHFLGSPAVSRLRKNQEF